MKAPTFRKRWLIYPKFQLTIILANLGISVIASLFVVYEIHRSFEEMRENIHAAGFPPDHPYYTALNEHLSSILIRVGGALVLTFIISGILNLSISQRLVGPIYRLHKYLENRLAGEKTKPLSFRKGDYFPGLPGLVNAAFKQDSPKDEKVVPN